MLDPFWESIDLHFPITRHHFNLLPEPIYASLEINWIRHEALLRRLQNQAHCAHSQLADLGLTDAGAVLTGFNDRGGGFGCGSVKDLVEGRNVIVVDAANPLWR